MTQERQFMSPTVETVLASFSPEARRLFDLWQTSRRGSLVPLRRDIDPMAVPGLLANIYIYRYCRDSDDFVCRLAGEAINHAWGGSIKGASLKQIVGVERHPAAIMRWKAIVATPRFQYGRMDNVWDGSETCVAERLVLPISENGEANGVLGYGQYRYRQTDRENVPPVWDGVATIDCADL